MTRYMKSPGRRFGLLLVAGILTASAVPMALANSTRAAEPQMSGQIVGGVGETPISPWVRGAEGCVGAATCSTWLQSGCAPNLGGIDPAFQAAVVDVGALADSSERTLVLHPEVVVFGARYTVQFWINSDAPLNGYWCEEILDLRFHSWDCFRHIAGVECQIRIPPHARWMTITSSPENIKTSWTLS